ncbi:MAG: ribosome biogenesis GTP-binding protein YsxC, partial [Clostridia bacterium]|nr:ribosome biogenesis GTP-binding protein YsxC [Clostridia bacterium]
MALVFQNTELIMTAGRKDQFPRDSLPQIALSGRSNVGKSSLINTVIGRKNYARTSSSPGKTVTINFYLIDRKIYLVDLPGYGFARRSGDRQKDFSKLTEEYITQDGKPDLVLQLIDL